MTKEHLYEAANVLVMHTCGTTINTVEKNPSGFPTSILTDGDRIRSLRLAAKFRNKYGKLFAVEFRLNTNAKVYGEDAYTTCSCAYSVDMDEDQERERYADICFGRMRKIEEANKKRRCNFFRQTLAEKEAYLKWITKANNISWELHSRAWRQTDRFAKLPRLLIRHGDQGDGFHKRFFKCKNGDWWELEIDSTLSNLLKVINEAYDCTYERIIVKEGNDYETVSYCQFLPDTTLNEIAALQPRRLSGLWFEYDGKHLTPSNIYFGCGGNFNMTRDGIYSPQGIAYCHYDNALHPVHRSGGEVLRDVNLRNVSARYDGTTIHDWYRE